jgi:hypothetical protein
MPKQIITLRQATLDELARRKKASLQPATASALAKAMAQGGHMAKGTVHYWLNGTHHLSDDKVDIILAHLGLKIKR